MARVDDLRVRERVEIAATAQYPAYERLSGQVRISIDPALPVNRRISDISLARTTHPHGWSSATANFMILRPQEMPENPVALIEVSNRGGKAALRYFQNASGFSLAPERPADFGDGLLMRRGLLLVWVGWQFDVPDDDPWRLRLEVPEAPSRDPANYGLVRADWVVDKRQSVLPLGHRNHQPYPAARSVDSRNVLTRRTGREAPREVVPRKDWSFVYRRDELGQRTPHVQIEGGAEPGYIYELVYLARDPKLVGMGLAAVRDMAQWLKSPEAGELEVDYVLGFGVSQSGRFLRQFLYQGFNQTEAGTRAFDGLLIHSAGAGRGSFNHRFAQPSRDAHRYSAFFYPTDLFPFSSAIQTDPVNGMRGGLLEAYADPHLVPRVMVTNTGYEYWGRTAALIHTRIDGEADIALPDSERIYHLASSQHFVEPWPPRNSTRLASGRAWQGNPLDFLVNLRALVLALADWVARDVEPPPSQYPRLDDGTLVPLAGYEFPQTPALRPPRVAHVAYRADYGRRWRQGIIDLQPPRLGPAFTALVPTVDEWGNERGGIRNVPVQVPVATLTPWSLREGLPNPGELADFRGTIAPLPWCDSPDDARAPPPHANQADYQAAAAAAADRLIAQRYLLQEDRQRVMDEAQRLFDWARQWPCETSTDAAEGGASQRQQF